MPSLPALGMPRVHTAQPGGVLNIQPVWKVSTPLPKWEAAMCLARGSAAFTCTRSTPLPPNHAASMAKGMSNSQPLALAMLNGIQR